MIESYSFGRMVIDGREYTRDLMILPGGEIVGNWWRKIGHELVMEDIGELLAAKPEQLVVGTGNSGVMRVGKGLENELQAKGIRLIALPTGQAVERYNSLLGKERLAACFHLTC